MTCLFCARLTDNFNLSEKGVGNSQTIFTPEQILAKLRQIEVSIAQGKSVPVACREAGISDVSYYRWRKEFGGLKLDQAKRLKELERENAKLKRLVAELSLEKQILKDVAEGNF